MPSSLQIRKVETKADFKPFFEFPWMLHKNDPKWVPPLLSMRREIFDKTKNPAWEYMNGEYFTAWRDDKIVGTIAAYINHRHNEFHDEQIGWFGAFDVYDDPEAASALLKTAIDWVKAQGFKRIRGPQTFTTHEESGLLVENFDRPILLMPYNLPYYATMIEAAGFHKVMDLVSFYADRATVEANGLFTRLERISQSVMKRNKITVRQFNGKQKKQDFALIKEIYNTGWEKNWGFVPLTPRELDGLVESLGQFLEPNLVYFAYVDDKPAGFILGIGDFNQVLLKAYAKPGTPEVVTLLKALYHWKIKPVMQWTRVPLLGVKAEYRNKGVDAAMYFYLLREMLFNTKYIYSDSGWVLEANTNMINITESFGAKIYKRFRLYEQDI